jgi:hypothetical protein
MTRSLATTRSWLAWIGSALIAGCSSSYATGAADAAGTDGGASDAVTSEAGDVAVGDDASDDANDAASDSASDAPEAMESSGPTVTAAGKVEDLSGGGIAMAKVCLDGSSTVCTMSDMTGAYSLDGVPASSDVLLVVSLDSYLVTLLPRHTPATGTLGVGNTVLIGTTFADAFASSLGAGMRDPSRALFAMTIYDSWPTGSAIDGATATYTPSSGTGIVYGAASCFPSTTATSTSAKGCGLAAAANVLLDHVDATVTKTGATCVVGDGGWASSVSGATTKIPLRAGAVTAVGVSCK